MDLYKELLVHTFARENIHITFPNLRIDAARMMELGSYQTLQKIKTIDQDDSLTDEECFIQIEEIICALESLGSSGGSHYDFG